MKGKILIIEDDIFWQKDLKEFLESDGFFVDTASDLNKAIIFLENNLYHFITVDMRLTEDDEINFENFEGWQILDTIRKLKIQSFSPVMVITGHGVEYTGLKQIKRLEGLYFMEKGDFNAQKFLEIINREISRIDLRFKNDHGEES